MRIVDHRTARTYRGKLRYHHSTGSFECGGCWFARTEIAARKPGLIVLRPPSELIRSNHTGSRPQPCQEKVA